MVRGLSTCAAALLALGAAGCAHRSESQQQLTYPFSGAGAASLSEQHRFDAAEEALVASCMHRRGFPYAPQRQKNRPDPGPQNLYGLLSVTQAEGRGYGATEEVLSQSPAAADKKLLSAMSPSARRAWTASLLGTTKHSREFRVGQQVLTFRTDSCTYAAHTAVMGSEWDALNLKLFAIDTAVERSVLRMPEVVAIQRRWSLCMADKKYQVNSISNARQVNADAVAAAVKKNSEIAMRKMVKSEQRMAVADAECEQKLDMWAVFRSSQDNAEKILPAQDADTAGRADSVRKASDVRAANIDLS